MGTIKDGDERVDREVRFEQNTQYKNTLIDLSEPSEANKLQQLLKERDQVLLRLQKDSLPEALEKATRRFKHQESIDRYVIYY